MGHHLETVFHEREVSIHEVHELCVRRYKEAQRYSGEVDAVHITRRKRD